MEKYRLRKGIVFSVVWVSIMVLQLLISSTVLAKEMMIGVVTTRHDPLNIRSGPGMDNPVIGKAEKNSTLSVTGKSDEWYHGQLPDGTVGYAFSQYPKIISRENILNTAEAFINAIGSERELYLEPGDYIFEGPLEIRNVEHLKIIGIQGDRPVRILSQSRYSNVLSITDSNNLVFEKLVIGHTERKNEIFPECRGGVLQILRTSEEKGDKC